MHISNSRLHLALHHAASLCRRAGDLQNFGTTVDDGNGLLVDIRLLAMNALNDGHLERIRNHIEAADQTERRQGKKGDAANGEIEGTVRRRKGTTDDRCGHLLSTVKDGERSFPLALRSQKRTEAAAQNNWLSHDENSISSAKSRETQGSAEKREIHREREQRLREKQLRWHSPLRKEELKQKRMPPRGIEPRTFRLQGGCSTN